MRILADAFAARGAGGGRWFTGALISEIARQKHDWEIQVYCADPGFGEKLSGRSNVEAVVVPHALGYGTRWKWQQVKLRKIIDREHIDLLFSPMNIGMLKPPIPQVTVQRNAHHLVTKVTQRNGGRWLARRLQLLGTLASIKSSRENVFVSRHLLEMARKWLRNSDGHWHVIYNAIDTERFAVQPDSLIDGDYLLYIGIITPHKNVDTLIKAFGVASRQFQIDAKLVLAGSVGQMEFDGFGRWGEYLLKLTEEQGLKSKVIFTGPVHGNRLVSLYRHAKACIVPSLLESFGIVPAEALFCGTPCLVSDIPVFREVYEDCVVYCDPLSPEDMAQKIVCLMEDSALQKKLLGQWEAIMPRFLLHNAAKEYSRVFEKAVGSLN